MSGQHFVLRYYRPPVQGGPSASSQIKDATPGEKPFDPTARQQTATGAVRSRSGKRVFCKVNSCRLPIDVAARMIYCKQSDRQNISDELQAEICFLLSWKRLQQRGTSRQRRWKLDRGSVRRIRKGLFCLRRSALSRPCKYSTCFGVPRASDIQYQC